MRFTKPTKGKNMSHRSRPPLSGFGAALIGAFSGWLMPGQAGASDFPSLQDLYTGSYRLPPSESPKPVTGKKIWFVSCSQDVSLCAAEAAGTQEAGRLLGWDTTIFDGKYDPAVMANGIRQAIAGKFDAVVLAGADCNGVKGPLAEARDSGLKIVSIEGVDCSVSDPGEPSLFDAAVTYVEGDLIPWVKKYGAWQADYVIAKTGGKAEAIVLVSDEVLVSKLTSEATIEELKRCPGCTVHEVSFSYGSQGPQLQQLAEQALLRFPNANSLIVPADSVILSGVGPAIEASGRDLVVVAAEGQEATMNLVRAGSRQVSAGVGIPSAWEGYAAVDALNRVFNGQPAVNSGAGLQVFDKDHNAGTAGAFNASTDFVAAYKKAWGITE
ncbi:sugar ABC transporter substrate-binding protein [Mesorhizobium sp. B2-8-3]|nr:sugar ABC transporter substrate-binding protein [Mesorhizobium sp. B2-8-3]